LPLLDHGNNVKQLIFASSGSAETRSINVSSRLFMPVI
jgi:hypothetical protein